MSMPIIMLFVVMAICFIIRMPVSFSMLAASITYFLLAAPDKLGQVFTVITGNMFANYTMLAAPLFIFMANVLNEGEVTDKLFSFCNGLLGRLKGGTAQVNVFISLIFSGMTGFCYRRCFRYWSDGDRPDEKRGLRRRVQLCHHSRFCNGRTDFPAKYSDGYLRYVIRCFHW